MGIGGYKIRDQSLPHFITFATVGWVDVFTKPQYANIIVESLHYLQSHRGLVLHGWCLMPSHLHLMALATNHDLSDALRDLKKFTSRQVVQAIENNPEETRREWMLKLFKDAGEANSRNKNHQFWRQDNQPKGLYGTAFMVQKLEYMHQNPVAAGLVWRPEHYRYSSAIDYLTQGKGLLAVQRI